MNTEKEKTAIERLKAFEPEDSAYCLCYSGGKDSDAVRILAALAGVKHILEHNLTTIDAPETVRYIRSVPGVHINHPERTMWELIVARRMPPTRFARYCCEAIKEREGKGRLKVTGVRWEESWARRQSAGLVRMMGKKARTYAERNGVEVQKTRDSRRGGIVLNYDNDDARRMVERCYRTSQTLVNPIIDWTEADVWTFLRHYGCDGNPLYQCGFSRIGCIGCPMKSRAQRLADFRKWPKYKTIYTHAFDRMLEKRVADGLAVSEGWQDGAAVFRWWLGEPAEQLRLDEDGAEF